MAAIRKELELDRPALVRYADWLTGCLRGDLGRSLANGREVADLVSGRLGRSLTLATLAALIAIPLAVGLGLIAALYEDRFTDKGISATTLAFVSMPEFLVGYMLLYVFAVKLGWLPALSRVSDACRCRTRCAPWCCPAPRSHLWFPPTPCASPGPPSSRS